MAGLMAAPIFRIELTNVGCPDKRRNALFAGGAVVFMAVCWFRYRTLPVTIRQFLRSMIPHHAGADPYVRTVALQRSRDPEAMPRNLDSQRAEIATMKAMLHQR